MSSQSSILDYVNTPAINQSTSDDVDRPASSISSDPVAPASSTSEKRPLSHSSTSSISPAMKRSFTFEGEDHEVTFDSDSPYWVPLLFKAFDQVNKNVMDLKADLLQSSAAQEAVKKEADERIFYLEEQSKWQGTIIRHLMKRDDTQEQYSSRECLILHGVPECKSAGKEDTDLAFVAAVNKLGVSISENDIDRSHRLGQKIPGSRRPRPIVAKLARHNIKAKIYANKRKFKGKQYMITERLTKRRATMFRYAREEYGKHNVWTLDGEIHAKVGEQINNITEYLYSIEESIIEKITESHAANRR